MATITEDYVSFETAKLLRKKGFDEPCNAYWFHMINAKPIFNDNMPHQVYNNKSDTIEIIGCPTIQMAMKWLREMHHLVIQIELIDFLEHGEVWFYSIIERKTIKRLTDRDEDFTEHSYEEACEAAIKYCLEHLI